METEKCLRLLFILFALVCLMPGSWAVDFASLAHTGVAMKSDWIEFQSANLMHIPDLIISGKNTWQYPYDYIPVYAENQTIKGTFHGPVGMAGSEVLVSISSFNTSTFLEGFKKMDIPAKIEGNVSRLQLNRSGDASFDLNKTSEGMYTISVIDENNSTTLSALPLLITSGEMSIDAQAQIASGDVLVLRTNISASENVSKIFAAMMISRTDFENGSLRISSNSGTDDDLNSTLSLGNKSVSMRGIPKISSELLMQIITLLPADSAVGMQETNGDGAEIILITGSEWEKGNYILICGVYSPGKGLSGIKEMEIEVI